MTIITEILDRLSGVEVVKEKLRDTGVRVEQLALQVVALDRQIQDVDRRLIRIETFAEVRENPARQPAQATEGRIVPDGAPRKLIDIEAPRSSTEGSYDLRSICQLVEQSSPLLDGDARGSSYAAGSLRCALRRRAPPARGEVRQHLARRRMIGGVEAVDEDDLHRRSCIGSASSVEIGVPKFSGNHSQRLVPRPQ